MSEFLLAGGMEVAKCTRSNQVCCLILCGIIAFLYVCPGLQERASAGDIYDQPLEVRHVALKPDRLNPQAKREVACFTYKHFIVKQVDLGEVGADRLSIMPVVPGKTPPCRQAKEPGEYVIPGDSWSGYFEGVRSDYAFFVAADGTNGGLGFMIFNSADRKRLFEDTSEKGIESLDMKDGVLTLRYRRVFAGGCSVVTEGAACGDAIAQKTGVSRDSFSSCATGYEAAREAMARSRCDAEAPGDRECLERELKLMREQKEWDAAPTVIVYEVEVALGGKTAALKPLSAVLACRPTD